MFSFHPSSLFEMNVNRADAIKHFYAMRRRAIGVFRRAHMKAYPLPTVFDNIVEFHRRRALLKECFNAKRPTNGTISFGKAAAGTKLKKTKSQG